MPEHTREPIISVLGHVDHGKTSVLDYIRDSVVASREAGGITQHIGATDIPFEVIEKVCGGLLKKDNIKIPLRGLLFIDTPGHAAFTNLRKRGGSVADLAVLVIDINEGLKPQTIESLEILKQYKTPFLICANKIDRISGYQVGKAMWNQPDSVKQEFDKRFYKLIGDLSIRGLECDLFNKIPDFTKSIAVVPCSAINGDGIKELLMMLIGLTQTFLKDKLKVSLDMPAKGTILEVKETKGLGTTIDAIIYDGTIRVNDSIVVAARVPIVTKVKALLRPKALDEMRDPKKPFKSVKEVYAASGVKIVAQNIESAMSGGPIYVGGVELVAQVRSEIGEVEFNKDTLGVIIKADTLGSLEAMVKILESESIPVKKGSIGKVSKQDIIEASAVSKDDKYLGALLVFNTEVLDDARSIASDMDIPLIESKIIYEIIEDYTAWVKTTKDIERNMLEKSSACPCKIKLLPAHVFRQSKPAIVGVEVVSGVLTVGTRLMREDGKICGRVRGIQSAGDAIQRACKGEQVAVSINDAVIGRQIFEEDTLYSFLNHEEILLFNPKDMTDDEKDLIRTIKKVKKSG